MNIPKINSISQEEIYKNNLELRLVLKNANISNKIIQSKIKKGEELYRQFKQRQNRLEIARINSELMNFEKKFKIEWKHMNRDINNKYRKINQIFNIYDINKYYNDQYFNYINKRFDFFNINKNEYSSSNKNKYM